MEEIIRRIWSKIDPSRKGEGKPVIFQGNASFTDCQLPPLDSMPESVRYHYISNVPEENIMTSLEKSNSLNRQSQAIKLHAINVPKDGNCLLHAVTVAVWGVVDSESTLIQLILKSVENDLDLKKRWCGQKMRNLHKLDKSDPKVISKEWNHIMYIMSSAGSRDLSATLPCIFSDPFYIYVLANIFRRPIIIVTKNLTTSGLKPQNDDIGGVYLPLEWAPIECCKTPIIIGYNFNHFYPLISESSMHNTTQRKGRDGPQVFPLVNNELGILCIRYLKEEEVPKAWDLVQSYLIVKELDVMEGDGSLTKVPCAQMNLKPLESTYNPLLQHLDFIKKTELLDASQGHFCPTSWASQQNYHPFYQTKVSNQTEVVQQGNPNLYEFKLIKRSVEDGESALTPTAPFPSLEPYSQQDYRFSYQTCPLYYEYHQTEMEQNKAKGQYMSKPVEDITSELDHILTPTAPFLSFEPQSNSQMLSMTAERCIKQCGYRCSYQTYPFCHECHEQETLKYKQKEQNCTIAPVSSQRHQTEFKGQDNVTAGKEKLNEQRAFDMKMTLVNSSTLSLTSPSAGLLSKYPDDSSSESSWFQQSEHPLLIDNHEIYSKGNFTDHSSKNSEQKMLYNYVSPENSKKIRSDVTLHQQKASSESDIIRETKNGSAETQGKESIDDHVKTEAVDRFSNDTKVLIEVIRKAKCASPYCSVLISGQEQLCNKCQDILKHSVQRHEEYFEKTRETTTKLALPFETEKEPAWKSCSGSYIQQATEDTPYKESLCEKYPEPEIEIKNTSCSLKLNPITHIQATSKAERNNVSSSFAANFKGNEKSLYKDINQSFFSSHNKDISCAHKLYNNIPLEAKATKTASDEVYNPFVQPTSNPSHQLSAQENAVQLSYDSNSSSIDLPYTAHPYTEQYHSFQPFESTSSLVYSIPSVSVLSNPELKSAVVTSMTSRHNSYGNSHQLPSSSSYSYKPEAKQNYVPKIQEVEDNRNTTGVKCKTVTCSNYGNREKNWYCNTCHKIIRRQRILEWEAKRGVDVPD